jgi:hypothetical protein
MTRAFLAAAAMLAATASFAQDAQKEAVVETTLGTSATTSFFICTAAATTRIDLRTVRVEKR